MACKCEIQWIIPEHGDVPTPDDNDSIGETWCTFGQGSQGLFRESGKSRRYLICADHAKRLGTLPNWAFEWHRGPDFSVGGKVTRHHRAVPPIGAVVSAWHAPAIALTVLRVESYAVGLCDTLCADASGRECWHAGYSLNPWVRK